MSVPRRRADELAQLAVVDQCRVRGDPVLLATVRDDSVDNGREFSDGHVRVAVRGHLDTQPAAVRLGRGWSRRSHE